MFEKRGDKTLSAGVILVQAEFSCGLAFELSGIRAGKA